MAIYRIHRMKETPRHSFRWAAHTAGPAAVKPRDYEGGGEVEAASPYSAWAALQGGQRALAVGDLLEDEAGRLRIFKYVGFEEAQWLLPEIQSGLEEIPPAVGAFPPVI